jgi:hypothetical protein
MGVKIRISYVKTSKRTTEYKVSGVTCQPLLSILNPKPYVCKQSIGERAKLLHVGDDPPGGLIRSIDGSV